MTKPKIILSGIVAAVILVGLILVFSTSEEKPASKPDNGNSPASPELAKPKPYLPCVIRVNEARCVRLDRQSPIYLQCVFINPLPDQNIHLPAPADIQPVLMRDGKESKLTWKPIGKVDQELKPQSQAIYTWVAKGSLPVGTYQAAAALPDTFPSNDGDVKGVVIEPGQVEILDVSPNEYRNAVFTRRLMLLEGDTGLLKKLQKMVAEKPDDISLRLELVDALEAEKKLDEARQELLEVGYRVQHPSSGKTRPVPPWLAYRLEDIQTRMAAKSAAPERSNHDAP